MKNEEGEEEELYVPCRQAGTYTVHVFYRCCCSGSLTRSLSFSISRHRSRRCYLLRTPASRCCCWWSWRARSGAIGSRGRRSGSPWCCCCSRGCSLRRGARTGLSSSATGRDRAIWTATAKKKKEAVRSAERSEKGRGGVGGRRATRKGQGTRTGDGKEELDQFCYVRMHG